MDKRYGLIGQKLGHSHSPRLHRLLGDAPYELIPLEAQALDSFLREGRFDGLNVTIPYKKQVIPYCAELSETARRIGSVNTLVRREDGAFFGDNTDAHGFAQMARNAGIDFAGQKALVLGSGGASLTACHVIREAGGQTVVISRQGENRYENLEKHQDATILVNTTPVGMFPDTDASPVDLRRLPLLRGVLDLIYNPLRTRLLLQAKALGIPHGNGLTMLAAQAARAQELFTGKPVPKEREQKALAALGKQVTNLVLVGMPGCGKTSLGKLLSGLLDLPLADMDAEVEQACGCTIAKLFSEKGEAAFRAREAELIARYGREGGRILVTGGGAVLTEANREHLQMNGFVVHITRPMSLLSMNDRPLSQSPEVLEALWEQRAPLYAACADRTIPNDKSPADCAAAIKEAYDEALCN